MKRGILISGALIFSSLQAAEPPANPGVPDTARTALASKPARLLDLRVGDIRKYMTPEEFQALRVQPDDSNTVLVQANAPPLPMKSELDVPGGIIAPFWALAHPTQAWRLFLPDPRVNIQNIPPSENKVPPPVFRWGP